MARTEGPRTSQGALPLSVAPEARDLLIGTCNRDAVAAVFDRPWTGALYLEGPAKSGKSLIAAVWAANEGARLVPAAGLDLERVPELAEGEGAAIDGIDALTASGEEALFHLFNTFARRGARLLITARSPARGLKVGLPDLATRLRAVPVARIGPPDEVFLERLLVRLAEARQLVLPPLVVAFILPRIPRAHEAAINLMEALDRLSLEAGRPVSRELAAEALKLAES